MDHTQYEFGDAFARATDPATSHAAAAAVEGEHANRMEKLVLVELRKYREMGLTNHQLVAATGIAWNTITPRVRPLVNKGLVLDSGLRRLGPKGKKCVVWKLA